MLHLIFVRTRGVPAAWKNSIGLSCNCRQGQWHMQMRMFGQADWSSNLYMHVCSSWPKYVWAEYDCWLFHDAKDSNTSVPFDTIRCFALFEKQRSIACCLPMLLLPYPLERPRYTQSRWAFYWQRQERIRATIVCGIPSWIAFGSLFQAIWQIIMCCNRQISIINWYPHSGRPRHVWPFEALLLVMEMHLKVRKAFLKNTRNSSPNCRLASHVVIHASIMSCPTGSLRLK